MKFVYILTTFVVFIDCRISKQETKQFSPAVFCRWESGLLFAPLGDTYVLFNGTI